MTESIKEDDFAAVISWSDITVSTISKALKTTRTILHNAHGYVAPGEFLAVMGPSGAGKTTLLNCLSNRRQKNLSINSGEILLNGKSIHSVPYSSIIGFVPQEDILFTSMTPREILDFAAALTLKISPTKRKELVEETLKDLGLSACANTLVGGPLSRGLSGGEKKRTSVGMELICSPSVLFLDEPTTGLDSFIALSIVQLIVAIAKKYKRTIIATIHQPSSQIFDCFDKLLLLSQGLTVYMGSARESISYFTDLGFPLPENYNPADHFLSVISENMLTVPEYTLLKNASLIEANFRDREVYSPPFLSVLALLTWRAYKDMIRNPLNLAAKIFKVIFYSMMFLAVFWDLGYDPQGIYDRESCIFILICSFSVEAHLSVLQTFQMHKLIFIREYQQNRYGALSYFLSYNFTTIPIEIIWDLVFLFCIYKPSQFNTAEHSLTKFAVASTLSGMTGSGWGMLISIVGSTLESAAVFSMLVLVPMWLCSGFLINYSDIPDWFFIKWIGPYYYTFQAGILSELEGLPGANGCNNKAIEELNLPNTYNEAILYTIILILAIRIFDYLLLRYIYKFN